MTQVTKSQSEKLRMLVKGRKEKLQLRRKKKTRKRRRGRRKKKRSQNTNGNWTKTSEKSNRLNGLKVSFIWPFVAILVRSQWQRE